MAEAQDQGKIEKAFNKVLGTFMEQQAVTNERLTNAIEMLAFGKGHRATEGETKPTEKPPEYYPHHEEHPPWTPEEQPLPSSPMELAAREGPKEEVLLRTAIGTATIAAKGGHSYALFHANLWTLDGKWDGIVRTVIQLEVDVKHEYTFPPRQSGSYDQPSDIQPVTELNQNRAKTKYTFKDGSTIEAVGVAVGYRVPMKDESFQIVVALTEAMSHGTGIYEGVKGLATFVGGTWFPATPAFNPGERSEHRSFHTIRLFRKVVQGPPPPNL